MKKFVLIIFFSITLCSNPLTNVNSDIHDFMNRYYYYHLSFFPLEATRNGFSEFNDKLNVDIGEDFLSAYKNFLHNMLDTLNQFDRTFLNDDLKISFDILENILITKLKSLDYPDYLMPVNHYQFLINFIQLGSGSGIQPFNTTTDYENFLSRLKVFPAWVDTAISNMRKGMQNGIVLPEIIAQRTLEIVDKQIVATFAQSDFYKPVLNFPEKFSSGHKIYFETAYRDIINNMIIPSFRKLSLFLSREYLHNCRNTIGLNSLPQGEQWYKHYIYLNTTTRIHPDTVMQLGLKEVEKILGEIETLKKYNLFEGSINAFRKYLFDKTEFFFSVEDIIKQYSELHEIVSENIPEYFSVIPKTEIEIHPLYDEQVSFLDAYYEPSSVSGTGAGVFFFNARFIDKFGAVPSKSLFLHEVIPGHHFQMSLHRVIVDLPLFQKFYWNSGYVEGWALYSEDLGKELGVYDNDVDLFVKYFSELLRAVRLVTDTGIHHEGWSYHEALSYFTNTTGLSTSYAMKEIDRSIVMPGQALSYKIGELIILQLRKLAETQLGEKFNLREFHDEILKDGAMPLDLLERKILSWIVRKSEIKN